MNKIAEVFVGVDVSKNRLDVHLHPMNKSFFVSNDSQGISKLLREISPYAVKEILCEASGGYERPLATKGRMSKHKLRVINPRRVRDFARAKGVHAKTDKIDAKMIALFGVTIPSEYEQNEISFEQMQLQEFVKYKNNLQEMLTEESARLKNPIYNETKDYIKKHVIHLGKQIDKIKDKIAKLIDTNEDMKKKKILMETMPGIGAETSAALIADMPELGSLNEKEVAALLGVAPFTQQSGNWKGTSSIRDGRFAPRKAVYMASLSASRYNPILEEFYKKLIARGKPPKVGLVALMRKIIITLNAMLRDDAVWNPQRS